MAALVIDVHVTDTYFVVAHFHYIMVGGMVMAYLGGMHFWWPKISGRLYPEGWGKLAALIIFTCFNLTFFPQFILGYMGMPRRYWQYSPEFQVLNVLSTAGATILAVGYLLPMVYFLWSIRYGEVADANPWGAAGLEWMTPSPPPTSNFDEIPTLTWEAYNYDDLKEVPLSESSPVLASYNPDLQHHFVTMEQQKDAAVMGMWVFLITEIMFFGGMFAGYMIYRYLYYNAWFEGSQHMDFWWGTINTVVLLCSSLTMAMGVRASQLGQRRATVIFLVTILFGLGFLGIKGIEYYGHWVAHQFPGTNFLFPGPNAREVEMFFSFYWAMTGFHALHVLIGIGLVSYIAVRSWMGAYRPDYHNPVENIGLYWHFVDIVSIYLYPLLYLISRKHVEG